MKNSLVFLLLIFCNHLFSQEIKFKNPSFEGPPRMSELPENWQSCGLFRESPPDIQPGSFGNEIEAFDGKTYIGMVVRDVGTIESIAQKLEKTIRKDTMYTLDLYLCKADKYFAYSFLTKKNTNYDEACSLLIWGGNSLCEKAELLAEVEEVNHNNWKKYEIVFKPKKNYKYIIFEAAYLYGTKQYYNGSILIDHLSPIRKK